MSTITREFTKEQLIARIGVLMARREESLSVGFFVEEFGADVEILKIAMASLEAEIHSYTFEDDPRPLYTAPPAPEFPEEITLSGAMDFGEKCYADGWNKCRIIMLKGGK